jgi:hypothetical protein
MAANTLTAQRASSVKESQLDVAVTYNAVRSNAAGDNSFWMQGGSVQIEGRIWRGLGVVADVAGSHASNINGSGVGLDMVTATFGPRYTWTSASHKVAIYGQGLVGEANGFNSLFPASTGATTDAYSLATLAGGGVNVNLSRRVSIRAIEADWLHTQLPNGTSNVQDNLRLGVGVVFRIK